MAAISSNATPPRNGGKTQFEILENPSAEEQMTSVNLVSPGYFAILKIPLLQGRIWNETENQNGAHTDPNPVALGGMSVLNFTFTPTADFAIASTGTTTQTVNAGQTATFTNAISVTAQNGFASQVNLSCSLPITATNTTCTVNPNVFASGSGTASVSVTTTARAMMPPPAPLGLRLWPTRIPLFLLTLLLAAILLRFARTPHQRLVGALPIGMLMLFLLLQAIGCGGGSSGPPPPTGTPAGTYTVTVTGTSGSTTHTSTLTLIVN